LALSNSKAAIRFNAKQDHRLEAQIFDENAGLRQNTLNGGFPGGSNGPPKSSGQSHPKFPCDHSTNGESSPAYAHLSTLRKPGR
jgi:hypothetical protein